MLLLLGIIIIIASLLIMAFNTPKTMLFIILLGLLLVWDKAYAEEKADMLGFGSTSCSEFAKEYRRNPVAIENWYYVWYTGFVTGMNTALSIVDRGELKRNVAAKSMDIARRELRQYCNDNPLSDFAHAALHVMSGMTAYEDKKVEETPIIKFK